MLAAGSVCSGAQLTRQARRPPERCEPVENSACVATVALCRLTAVRGSAAILWKGETMGAAAGVSTEALLLFHSLHAPTARATRYRSEGLDFLAA